MFKWIVYRITKHCEIRNIYIELDKNVMFIEKLKRTPVFCVKPNYILWSRMKFMNAQNYRFADKMIRSNRMGDDFIRMIKCMRMHTSFINLTSITDWICTLYNENKCIRRCDPHNNLIIEIHSKSVNDIKLWFMSKCWTISQWFAVKSKSMHTLFYWLSLLSVKISSK